LIRDQRKILDMTATSWLSFREFNGLLVYYTHLMSYRCAIREVRVGIDSAVPDKALRCRPAIPGTRASFRTTRSPISKLAPATKSVSVELTYRDGSVPRDQEFPALKRFRAKWVPFRVKKTRQNRIRGSVLIQSEPNL
jgi:hypothetical protein